ncbi:hypothetical protein [Duganella sp. FT27W]|uniref:hypothetical protein n=1 Tax=Duganella sp. FT27W TaxID=2654636 RepID=UPI00128B217C|nr:hypothetical protein [Duganella sp. FT27W]MPQ57218.1 hypothetical protein [Duganella sp. FT27W]
MIVTQYRANWIGCGTIIAQLAHMPFFFAFLIDSEEVLLVDPELHERMRFLDEDISLEVISGESIASGLQV